jgi:hypothetical protein
LREDKHNDTARSDTGEFNGYLPDRSDAAIAAAVSCILVDSAMG